MIHQYLLQQQQSTNHPTPQHHQVKNTNTTLPPTSHPTSSISNGKTIFIKIRNLDITLIILNSIATDSSLRIEMRQQMKKYHINCDLNTLHYLQNKYKIRNQTILFIATVEYQRMKCTFRKLGQPQHGIIQR